MSPRKCIDPNRASLFRERLFGLPFFRSVILLVSIAFASAVSAADEAEAAGSAPQESTSANPGAVVDAADSETKQESSPEEESSVETSDSEGAGGADADGEGDEAGTGDESGEESDVTEVVVEESPFASPEAAMVAVRGDASVGLGALTRFDDKLVVVTSLSSLVGSRRIVVNTADGEEVPVVGIVGVYGADLAFLAVNDQELDLPYCEMKLDFDLKANDTVRILNPRGETEGKISGQKPDRYVLNKIDGPVFSGSPVVVGRKLVGVYSPSRMISIGASGRQPKVIWEAGVVPFYSNPSWESINLSTLAVEDETLEEAQRTLGQVGSLLGVGGKGELTLQRLISARDRLANGLAQSSLEVEKDNARKRFVFSVRSTAGTVGAVLEEAALGYSSYFQPEIAVLTEIYAPIEQKVKTLSENPRTADSFAR